MNREKSFGLILPLIAALCALLLAGCGTKTAPQQTENTPSAQETQTQEPPAQETQPEETPGSRRDIPLDSELLEQLDDELYEANKLAALLKNHDSIVFDLTDAPDNGLSWRNYFYITADACYYESPDASVFEYDRVYYFLYNDGENWPQLRYGVDLCSDYDLFSSAGYQFVPEDRKTWFNSEVEEHVACYVEDGLLHILDRANAEKSAEWFAENLPFETYGGETMYSEVVADEESKEIAEFNFYLESKDGTMKRVIHETAAYDVPEPRRVSNLWAAAERYCENTIDVTMTVDPGTEREFSRSITLPVGSVINYRCDNMDKNRIVSFDDAEATRLTHWDGMQSKNIYLFTEPSEELIARYDALVQAMKNAG
ncbi:MAG: hypothetical protein J5449_10215 [Oscillospiraceae bacterium]|nr:hypothetical protein [Oscillospiraceae bacterium]